jgi:hypothetical protein
VDGTSTYGTGRCLFGVGVVRLLDAAMRTGEEDGKLRGDEEGSPGEGNLAGDDALRGDEERNPGEGNPLEGNLAGDGAREVAHDPTMLREDLP